MQYLGSEERFEVSICFVFLEEKSGNTFGITYFLELFQRLLSWCFSFLFQLLISRNSLGIAYNQVVIGYGVKPFFTKLSLFLDLSIGIAPKTNSIVTNTGSYGKEMTFGIKSYPQVIIGGNAIKEFYLVWAQLMRIVRFPKGIVSNGTEEVVFIVDAEKHLRIIGEE